MTRLNENSPLRRPTEFSENEKWNILDNPDLEPSLSDSSLKKSSSDSSSRKKKRDKKKKRRKHRKYNSSDPFLSERSDSSDDSDYRRKQHKKKSHWKNYPIKLCARLTTNFLTTVYKSKIIGFKIDEDPLQRRIYFLTFIESLEMIFSQYIENYEVITDYPKIGGDDIEDYAKKALQEYFACKYWCTQQKVGCWVPSGWNKVHWKIAITLCKHEFFWQNYILQDSSTGHT